MSFSPADREVLRRLADRQAQIAALPIHRHTAGQWARLNRLERGKPMVWINEICWNEFNDPFLKAQCADGFARWIEHGMRQTIYQWEHMPVDMVVEDVVHCPLAIHDTGFGFYEEADVHKDDPTSAIDSRHFKPLIHDEQDIQKIRTPVVTHDEKESDRRYALLHEAIGDLIRVEKRGMAGAWFAPWDDLIRRWGIQEALMDLVLRPELVHMGIERLVNAYLARLDQWEKLNLLSLNNTNVRVGSGGLGYTDELPRKDFDPAHVRPMDLWGSATAQIFSEVSPEMHEEFALRYERRWLERFGLTYYGCCEPLHLKIDILKKVPNLRKISMSPWVNVERAAAAIENRYVFSRKPNPAVLATDDWNLADAQRQLIDTLDKTRGCVVEVIMKDISTVRYQPHRLHEWARMAAEVTAKYA